MFFHAAGVITLLIGLLSASLIYWDALNREEALARELENSGIFVVEPADSKMYRHDLERFGGKAAVLADDLNRWFSSLWSGKRLAIIVAAFSMIVAYVLFRAGKARRPPSDSDRAD